MLYPAHYQLFHWHFEKWIAGWEKVWRAAAWAQLGNSSEFYHQLSVSVSYYYWVDSCIRLIGYSMPLKEIMARTYSVCITHSTRIPYSRSTQTSDIRLLSWYDKFCLRSHDVLIFCSQCRMPSSKLKMSLPIRHRLSSHSFPRSRQHGFREVFAMLAFEVECK